MLVYSKIRRTQWGGFQIAGAKERHRQVSLVRVLLLYISHHHGGNQKNAIVPYSTDMNLRRRHESATIHYRAEAFLSPFSADPKSEIRRLKLNWLFMMVIAGLYAVSYTSISSSFHQFITNPTQQQINRSFPDTKQVYIYRNTLYICMHVG